MCNLLFTEGAQENLAFGKPTWASSTYGGSAYSALAVDGNANPQWSGHSCACTNQDDLAWWAVDLGAAYYVTSVRITNRGDCCRKLLIQLIIYSKQSQHVSYYSLFKWRGAVNIIQRIEVKEINVKFMAVLYCSTTPARL